MTAGAVLGLAWSVAAAAGTPASDGDADVVCKVNGEPVRVQDVELEIYWDERAQAAKDALDFLVQERLVRQEVARKGISVKAEDVDGFLADLDREIKLVNKKDSLDGYLAAQGITMGFFRRKTETVIDLYCLAGGKGRAYPDMKDADIKKKMNETVAGLTAAGKVETDPAKLDAGVAAVVNGERIGIGEVGHVTRLSLSDEARQKHLHHLQIFLVIRQEMKRRGLELTKDDLDYHYRLFSNVTAGAMGDKEVSLEQVLKGLGQDLKALREKHSFQAQAMLTRMVRDQVTDDELPKIFAKQPAVFGEGMPTASQILLKTVDADGRPLGADADRKIRARAQALREKLAAGEDFAALAGKFSEDKDTAEHGGNMGFLSWSRSSDPAVRAAWGLKVGEISQPVRSALGWHLVKVMEVKHVAFEDVKQEVRREATRLRRSELLEKLTGPKNVRIEPGPAKL